MFDLAVDVTQRGLDAPADRALQIWLCVMHAE